LLSNRGAIIVQSLGNVALLPGTKVTANGGSVEILGGGVSPEQSQLGTEEQQPIEGPILSIRTVPPGAVFLPLPVANIPTVTFQGSGNILTANKSLVILNTNPGDGVITVTRSMITALPIGFVTGLATHDTLATNTTIQSNQKCSLTTNGDWFKGEMTSDGASVSDGTCIVRSIKASKVHTAGMTAELPSNCVLMIEKLGSLVKFKNLSPIVFKIRVATQQVIAIGPSQELVIDARLNSNSLNDGTGRRRIQYFSTTDGLRCALSEFSMSNILLHEPLLKSLRFSELTEHQEIFKNIQKTAAAYSAVTSAHGPFFCAPQ